MNTFVSSLLTSLLLGSALFVPLSIAQDTATIREVPSNTSPRASVVYHPEYKKLLEEVRFLEQRMKTADDASAARERQQLDAAKARLQAYIDAGKPTLLSSGDRSTNRDRSAESRPESMAPTADRDPRDGVDPRDAEARDAAYERYIRQYNKLTSLMAQGRGETPEGQAAYQEYKKARADYERALSRQ